MEGRAIARPNVELEADAAAVAEPSMEGRAIARPNAQGCGSARMLFLVSFNGGPGNCPAKREWHRIPSPVDKYPSMEGRAIARPNRPCTPAPATSCSLQWRAGQLPGQTSIAGSRRSCRRSFNGGPGNCPAKRHRHPRMDRHRRMPSMEGRAIARPNPPLRPTCRESRTPSMEGRAIARPNWAAPRPGWPGTRSFNGGPGNCPAKPVPAGRNRARTRSFNGGPGNCPAKPRVSAYRRIARACLQWRAGQLPGQTPVSAGLASGSMYLQWRAGQLPGQTR